MDIREVTYLAVALRILTAIILGGLLGLERGLKNRAAGLRTYMLVCVGACLIMVTNQYIYQVYKAGDPVRMGAQVVSGIGFLGAGTIIITRKNQIKGLTTAAGLWASAGVGLALGIGFYEAALCGTLAVFFVLTLLQKLDSRVHRKARDIEVYIELTQNLTLGDFLRQVRELGIEVRHIQKETGLDSDTQLRAYIASLRTPTRRLHAEVLDSIQQIEGIAYLESV